MGIKRHSYALTDIGQKRKINQDAYLADDVLGLYVVADGMGGHSGGEVASRLAVEIIQKYCQENYKSLLPRDLLTKSINLSSKEIFKASLENPELTGMGTTVASIYFESSNGTAFIGQVGDSRVYLIKEGKIWQLTEDHSLVNEEIRAGRLPAGQAFNFQYKNVITRSVGYEDHVLVDIYRKNVESGESYLLCSDGLSGLVQVNEILHEIVVHGPELGLSKLVGLANIRGGDDNITAVVVEVCKD